MDGKTNVEDKIADSYTELQRYISGIDKYCFQWYLNDSRRTYKIWQSLRFIAIMASVLSSIIAGVMEQHFFETYGRILLVVIPAVGAAAGVLLSQFRLFERMLVSEEARTEFHRILEDARRRTAATLGDNHTCDLIYKELIDEVTMADKRYTQLLWGQFSSKTPPSAKAKTNRPTGGRGSGDRE